MRQKSVHVWGALALLAITAACEKASPTRPSDVDNPSAAAASVTDARTGATIVAARPAAPAANAQIAYSAQPITLSVTNGTSTGSAALTYTFEVAQDAGFTQKSYTKDGVPAGSGTTSQAVDKLGGSRTYYWRVRADSPSGPGPYSAVRTFTVGPEVVLGTPSLSSPVNSSTAFSPLALIINNVPRQGPAGAISYHVDVSANDSFGAIIFSTDAPEQGGAQTSVTAAVNGLSDGVTYFWRARATDTTNNITTPFSSAGAFVAQSFNVQTAKFWDNPSDAGTWPVTARITYVEFTGFSMRVDFDRRTGPGKWEEHIPPGFAGPLQYTLGMCRFVQNSWNCSAVVQFWDGRDLDSTAEPSRFWREWWYDGARWGPLADSRGPAEGEIVGIFVGSGDLRFRGYTRATCPNVCEMSNVQMVPFTAGYAKYEF